MLLQRQGDFGVVGRGVCGGEGSSGYKCAGLSRGGDPVATKFIDETIARRSFCLSILSVIEFLGWHGHTDEEFIECKELIELAAILPVSKEVGIKR